MDPDPKKLDTTVVGGAVRLESAYVTYWKARGVVLRSKYRRARGTYPQWGTGGDRAGRARVKSHKTSGEQRERVLLVSAGSGKSRFVDASEVA